MNNKYSEFETLDEFLSALNKCSYCGRICLGDICRDETGEMCDGEEAFAMKIQSQLQYEEEMRRYDFEQWIEYMRDRENNC